MDITFEDLNHCCLVYINDIFVFSKTIEQHKNDILAVTQRYIDNGIILCETSAFMLNKNEVFRFRNKR